MALSLLEHPWIYRCFLCLINQAFTQINSVSEFFFYLQVIKLETQIDLMKLQETEQGTVIEILVTPKSKQFQVKIEDDEMIVFCREAPVKGKVNRELTKELSRLFKRRVQIISGFTSRQKKLLIADINIEDFREILSAHESE